MEMKVASKIPSTPPMGRTKSSGTPASASGPDSIDEMAGSIVYPVSRVVRVIPSCALERCVDVRLSAEMVMEKPFSPLARLASKSARSRLSRANSLPTKTPVPSAKSTPTENRRRSELIGHPSSGSPRVYDWVQRYQTTDHPLRFQASRVGETCAMTAGTSQGSR